MLLLSNATAIQPDPNTTQLVYATWALVLVTLGLVFVTWLSTRGSLQSTKEQLRLTRESNKLTSQQLEETRKSNDLLMLELKAKFKPQFDFANAQLYHEPTNLTSVNFSCVITNKGNVPISNITIYRSIDSAKITLDSLLKDEEKIKTNEYNIAGSLETGRFHELKFMFDTDTRKDIWIAIWLKYVYLNNIHEEGIAIYYFNTPKTTGGFQSMVSTGFEWYAHNNVQNSRIELLRSNKTSNASF